MSRGSRPAVVGLCLAVLGATAGCGGHRTAVGLSPTPLPPTVSSVSTTASTPSAVNPNSDAAVAAGVRGWIAALNVAGARASLEPLRAWAVADCPCLRGADQSIVYLQANHLHLNVVYLVSAVHVTARKGSLADATVTVVSASYEALDPNGQVVRTEPATHQTVRYSLSLRGARWLVAVIY